MHAPVIAVCVSLLSWLGEAPFLWTVFHPVHQNLPTLCQIGEILQQPTKTLPPSHSLHDLYSEPQKYTSRSYPPLQQPIQTYQNGPNEVKAGTISMLSTAAHFVSVDFTSSSSICDLGIDALLLAEELASWILAAHPSGPNEANQTIFETVKLNRNDAEHRVTLSLTILGEIDESPFLGLIKLLVRVTEALFDETGKRGFGTLVQTGEFDEMAFEASWTWYEFVDGIGRKCESYDTA